MLFLRQQGGHGTGKTGNLVLTFSREGKHNKCNKQKKKKKNNHCFSSPCLFFTGLGEYDVCYSYLASVTCAKEPFHHRSPKKQDKLNYILAQGRLIFYQLKFVCWLHNFTILFQLCNVTPTFTSQKCRMKDVLNLAQKDVFQSLQIIASEKSHLKVSFGAFAVNESKSKNFI